MADGKGNEIHPSPISSEGHQYLLVLLLELNVAAEVPAKADLDDDEGVFFLLEGGRVRGGSVWDPACIG